MVRIAVIGSSGAGKTTFGRAVAARLVVPFVELDSLFHQRDWTPLPDADFRSLVQDVVDCESWVIDGNYGVVRPLVMERATTVVWLDYPRSQIMRRVVTRSLMRAVTREELWNGNRERLRSWVDPTHPIRGAWSHFYRERAMYASAFEHGEYGHLDLQRFRSSRDATRWMHDLG